MSNASGASVSSGSAAVSSPNVNNAEQIDSSLIVGGGGQPGGAGAELEAPQDAGGNVFADVMGSSFTQINSNSANKDNIVTNAHLTTINGDQGETTNGEANNIGDSQHVAGFVRRRDVVVNNGAPIQPVVLLNNQFESVPVFVPVGNLPFFV
ncbi:hypothetical protein GGF39_003453 [Coemansia sp. RSA 1721]|nr:hypothetical protein GGF39_003453 [Coemansia sp. RSA 1721]